MPRLGETVTFLLRGDTEPHTGTVMKLSSSAVTVMVCAGRCRESDLHGGWYLSHRLCIRYVIAPEHIDSVGA